MMTTAYINRIATAAPPNDVHDTFVRFAHTLFEDNRGRTLFQRMAERAQIHHRWSCLAPADKPEGDAVDADGFYTRGLFPSTAQRMARYELEAPALAAKAVDKLQLGQGADSITHLIVVSCTGFFAPGIDLELARRCGLAATVERTTIGFMGCQAGLNGLKLARHIVRSEPDARVLVVAVEICTLHMQETRELEKVLAFLLFGDGCAAALVSAEPEGLALERFHAAVERDTGDFITWNIGDQGFEMVLSGEVPNAIGTALRASDCGVVPGVSAAGIRHWAVHPGGRSILDAVQAAIGLGPDALVHSRRVLSDFGNMSSATVLFVLKAIMESAGPGESGCAMAFGPGLSTESLLFSTAG